MPKDSIPSTGKKKKKRLKMKGEFGNMASH
jgi:hypothetical protein